MDTNAEMEFYYKQILEMILHKEKQGIVTDIRPRFICCDAENRTLKLSFKMYSWMLNPENIIHGGLTTTIFDTAFGIFSHYYAKDNFITTVNISTTFLKPLLKDDIVEVTVKGVGIGKTLLTLTGEMLNVRTGKLSATSTSTMMILDKKVKL